MRCLASGNHTPNETLTSVSFPKATKIIGSAFARCTNLNSVTFPQVTEIQGSAFESTPLETVSFPLLTKIIGSAFRATKFKSINSEDFPLLTEIGDNAFANITSLENVSLPLIESIGQSAFNGCTVLENVSFPKIIEIGTSAFSGCTKLTSVEIPLVEIINSWAFSLCTSLESVSFPAVTEIGGGAFSQCNMLRSVTLPGSVTLITGIFPPPPTGPPFPGNLKDVYEAADGGAGTYVATRTSGDNAIAQWAKICPECENAPCDCNTGDTPDFVVTNATQWQDALTDIRNSTPDKNSYIIEVTSNFGIPGILEQSFGSRTGITVTLTGGGTMYLNSQGSMLWIDSGQTVILEDLKMVGLKNGQNGSNEDNFAPIVHIMGGTFDMKGGEISGNSSDGSMGTGVYTWNSGTFTMSGGEISGNYCSSNFGAGVLVSNQSIGEESFFAKTGGVIYGNDAADAAKRNTTGYDDGGVSGHAVFFIYINLVYYYRDTTLGENDNISTSQLPDSGTGFNWTKR
jgi:hypothetical protein